MLPPHAMVTTALQQAMPSHPAGVAHPGTGLRRVDSGSALGYTFLTVVASRELRPGAPRSTAENGAAAGAACVAAVCVLAVSGGAAGIGERRGEHAAADEILAVDLQAAPGDANSTNSANSSNTQHRRGKRYAALQSLLQHPHITHPSPALLDGLLSYLNDGLPRVLGERVRHGGAWSRKMWQRQKSKCRKEDEPADTARTTKTQGDVCYECRPLTGVAVHRGPDRAACARARRPTRVRRDGHSLRGVRLRGRPGGWRRQQVVRSEVGSFRERAGTLDVEGARLARVVTRLAERDHDCGGRRQ